MHRSKCVVGIGVVLLVVGVSRAQEEQKQDQARQRQRSSSRFQFGRGGASFFPQGGGLMGLLTAPAVQKAREGSEGLRSSGIGQEPGTAMLGDTLKVEAEGFSVWAVGAQWNVEGQQLSISLP